MNFSAACAEVMNRQAVRTCHSFESVRAALERLGNPQNRLKYIHITGTNGKGSVAHLCALALARAGIKTGLFVSPHLADVCERISINGLNVSEPEFAGCVGRVVAVEAGKLTFFELLACAAFLHFAENSCGFVVLEAGIGGRLDVTNIIGQSAISVITSVGLDHTELLGGTVEAIAAEKAGIIKSGGVCVCGAMEPSALAVIEAEAVKNNARLIYAPQAFAFRFAGFDWEKGETLLHGPDGSTRAIAALGRHYAANAATVFAVLAELRGMVPGLTPELAYESFLRFSCPARFQVIRNEIKPGSAGVVIVDGAHNPQAAAAFADTFRRSPYCGNQDRVLVIAVMRDKNYRAVLAELAPLYKRFIATRTSSERALPADELAAAIQACNPAADVVVEPDAKTALRLGLGSAVCAVAGSFYLAGSALSCFNRRLKAC
ncbi:MAG: Mur ligase family protein [Elusimicrobiaceae bacterium]|nr:Mur ligase family protein [Elusimicrobiaceae bacterium]